MMRKILIGALASAAAISMAVAMRAGDLAPYVSAMGSAKSLDVTYSITEVGGSQSMYHVVLAKPDKAMVDTPTMTTVADGKEITVYNKSRNTFYTKAQTKKDLELLFGDDDTSVWKPFFDSDAFSNVARTKVEGTRKHGSEMLKTIAAQVDPNGEFTIKFHIAQSDNLVRQAEFINQKGAASKISILNVQKMSMTADDSAFAFVAPANAKQLTEADMMTAEWIDNDLNKALELAATTGKGVMIDVYADW
ncbi:MAG TPA: hypothetical protein VNI20_10360 [Fimbriimonadaceae bacterium]|nr:hypothetical protein [Fimbriimonadaceae bacterium]